MFGFPSSKVNLLPNWVTPIEDPEFPDDSIVIADEAYRQFYSRESMSDANKLADQFAGLVGQKGVLAIYLTQTARKLEIALVSGAQVFLLKKPSRLMVLLDRSALRPLLARAFDSFQASSCPPAEATYVVSDPFEGFLEHSNSPPSFWSDELSRVWRGVSMAGVADTEETFLSSPDIDYQALFRAMANAILTMEIAEVKWGILAIDHLIKGEPLTPELYQALAGAAPFLNQPARQMIASLGLTRLSRGLTNSK